MPQARRPPQPTTVKSAPSARIDLLISLALALAVFVIYLQTRTFDFLRYDDPEFVVNNLHIRSGLTPDSLRWAFETGYAANWVPLTWISFMLGIDLYGLASGWHHLTNVALHAANSVLLFLLLQRLTSVRWPSALAAALFAVHPLHVEAVAWIAERREVLSGLFWMLTIHAWLRYAKQPRLLTYVLAALAFACGLMSKPMIVTLPFALLLLDFWPLRRFQTTPLRRLVLEKMPLIALSAAASAITLLVQRGAGAASSLTEVPFHFRIANALVSYLAYLLQFFWPARLAVLYPYAADLPAWQPIGATAVLLAITLVAIAQRRQRPYLLMGWLWFAGILVPVIGLVQVGVQSRADRYMYIPLIGLAVIVAWGLFEVAGRRATAVAAIACCTLGVAAWNTTASWRDTITLFRHAVDVTDDNWAAANVLGQALLAANRVDEAVPYIQQTLRLRPGLPEAHVNLGAAFSKRGDFPAAAAQYRAALAADPRDAEAQDGLGVVLTEMKQYEEARTSLEAAAQIAPADADVRYNLGRLYGLTNRPDLAIAQFGEAVRLQPANASARFNLGTAYAARGQFAAAAEQFVEALRVDPDYVSARFNLGAALANLGRLDDAIAQFREVVRTHSDFPGAAEALQTCLEMKK